MKKPFILLCLLFVTSLAWSQMPGGVRVQVSHKTQVVNGKRYFIHIVDQGQTVYSISRAYGLTILVTAVGTFLSLVMTSLFAYPLSRKDFKPRNTIAFILFFISSTAEMNRAPFDIAEAEQELTGGYHTEYNGTPFAMFYLAEYIALVTNSALATTCFLGGFLPPCIGVSFVDNYLNMVPGVVWFFAKVFFMIWCYMMVRWTFVRPRVDQLMDFEWKFLLPVNLVLLVAGAAYIVVCG